MNDHAHEEFLLALPTYLAPIWFTLVGHFCLSRWGKSALWLSCVLCVAVLMAFRAITWYWYPHYASSPDAAIALELVLAGPTLAAVAGVLQLEDATPWPMWQKLGLAAVVGAFVLWMSLLPGLVVFIEMGGDTL